MEKGERVLLASIGALTIVAVASLATDYNAGVFESVKSAILIIAGYGISMYARHKEHNTHATN